MSEQPSYIGIYQDATLEKPISRLYFGRLDAGEKRRVSFYLRNESQGDIEELRVMVKSPDKRGLDVKLLTPTYRRVLEPGKVYEGIVEWTTSDDLKAGPYYGEVLVEGMLTRE